MTSPKSWGRIRSIVGSALLLKSTIMLSEQSPPPLPDFEDEATLYSLSSEFLEAATVLSDTPPTRTGCSLVTYYLAGHAAELMLKSLLCKDGDRIDFLARRYGHDLKLLIRRARHKGLPTAVSTEHILAFAGAYTRKRTEYRRNDVLRLPPLDLLLLEIKRLHSHVFDSVAEI
ncbi:MAG: hypothetical protein QM739_08705 [Propionivibrio sp.]